ncbi:hypothetical protein ACFW04_006323 [Cataglyphis niger]
MTEEGKGTVITHMPHHVQQKLCQTRPPYRQGKRLTAVKVYTINDESQHLLICGVPKVQLGEEVGKLVYPYGDVKAIQLVTEYPTEEFTETYHVHYARIQSARVAKRLIDNKNFFGGILHVFYVPELETLAETKAKLIQRHKDIAIRIKKNQQDLTSLAKFVPKEQYHRKKKNPALPLTEERLKHCYPGETLSSICNGIPQNIDPRPVLEPRLPINWNYNNSNTSGSKSLSAPYQPTEAMIQTEIQQPNRNSKLNMQKRKNYKGQHIDGDAKVKIFRPRLIDTRNIAKSSSIEKTNVFCNVKKVESGITVKLLEKSDTTKKKIVIKDPNVTHLIQSSKDLQYSIQAAKSQIRSAMQKNDT